MAEYGICPKCGSIAHWDLYFHKMVCIGADCGFMYDKKVSKPKNKRSIAMNKVSVRWHDGYLEEFEATEVRFGSDLLWMRLEDGKNHHIPLRSVRWFGMSQESHQAEPLREEEE